MSMEIEGKTYALGFLDEVLGEQTIEKFEDAPGCKLEPNKPLVLLENILPSEFEGVVLNPGLAKQRILGTADLRVIERILKTKDPTGLGWLKKAIT